MLLPVLLLLQTATVTLPRATVEFSEPFTGITSVRELADGRVFVVDAREAAVHLVDLTRGTATLVGRQGAGPGEYQAPSRVLPLRGDSTLLTDTGLRRGIVLSPDGRAGAGLLSGQLLAAAPSGARAPSAIDLRGRLYFTGPALDVSSGTPTPLDSVPLLRYDPAGGRLDTVTSIMVAKRYMKVEQANGKIRSVSLRVVPLMAHDDWTLLADGRVAVVRTGDYHLDIVAADRRTIRGLPIPYTPVPVTDADRKSFPAWAQLPRVKPPFDGPSTFAAPDERIWVRRTSAAGDSIPHYDVLDLSGRLVAQVSLQARTRVAGVGRGAVYVVRRDEDDLEYLGRIALPRL
jgi:hypothetical protein